MARCEMSVASCDHRAGLQRRRHREYLFKVLVLGEMASGKTSYIKRYVNKSFSSQYRATVGLDFALKIIQWPDSRVVRLQLWDIAGQERFGNMTRVYYKEAVGAFIIFDVARRNTLDAVIKWKNDLDMKVSLPDGSNIPTVLLANKCDLEVANELSVNRTYLDKFCEEHKINGWFYTSAKENINIEESAHFLLTNIMSRQDDFDSHSQEADVIMLDTNYQTYEEKQEKCDC